MSSIDWRKIPGRNACRELVGAHCSQLATSSVPDDTGWKTRHVEAWQRPCIGREFAVKQLITAFAAYADSYTLETEGERKLGQDGYFSEHARDMIDALLAMLNFDCGRYDCGTLDRLICQLAEAAGVEMED